MTMTPVEEGSRSRDEGTPSKMAGLPEDASQWTAKLRRKALTYLPPEKLMPDRQPEYVSSWIYVFGVLTLSAFLVVAISGALLALEGPSWWHESGLGHFVNSLHLWSVELFFLFMVVHLWGKFFMAAWRGKRSLTWITGVLAFLTSVGAAFTGYVSQQNFDSQWISTQAKDGMNSMGIGAFFNVLNFGQMFMWHILLLPLIVLLIVGVHVMQVRLRGVVPPIKANSDPMADSKPWSGKYRPYDIIKEFTIGFVVVAIATLLFSFVFSSPDMAPVTIKSWSHADPVDFVTTAASELAGTSATATYGAPYNNVPGTGQKLGPISIENAVGVHIPVNPTVDFVLAPLSTVPNNPALTTAIQTWKSASTQQQTTWMAAYDKALNKAKQSAGDSVSMPSSNSGPVPELMNQELVMAQSGGLDGALESSTQFYGTNYTKPLLFIADGGYLASLAQADHLTGSQWGMMNETGSYPGQAWLWLYTMWYQVKPYSTSTNADVEVMATMIVLTLALALVPFIPGLRAIPEKVGIYKLIWKDYYRSNKS